jgi:predicted transcriptional regulator
MSIPHPVVSKGLAVSNLRRSSGYLKQTRALLSIRPQFAEAILRGEKKYEFRRSIFSRPVDVVVIYVTTPVQKVVAEFDVISIISESLPNLWRRTKKYAGIDEDIFYGYFEGLDHGHAICIGDVRTYKTPYCPVRRLGLKPPQSYAYLDK